MQICLKAPWNTCKPMIANTMMKKTMIIMMSFSMMNDWNRAFSMLRSDLILETDLKGRSTLSTLRGFKFSSDAIFCRKLEMMMMKSSTFQLFFK